MTFPATRKRCPYVWGSSEPCRFDRNDEYGETRCVLEEHGPEVEHDWPLGVVRRYIMGEDVVLVPDERKDAWK